MRYLGLLKKRIVLGGVILGIVALVGYRGYLRGAEDSFSKIQSGECWLTKDGINRDINCIVQLD